MNKNTVGIHILAEFRTKKYLEDIKAYTVLIQEIAKRYKVQIVGSSEFVFDTNGYTATFLLAESHINVHTWPEYELVHLDLFMCNYQNDNSIKVKKIFAKIQEFFGPYKTNSTVINR